MYDTATYLSNNFLRCSVSKHDTIKYKVSFLFLSRPTDVQLYFSLAQHRDRSQLKILDTCTHAHTYKGQRQSIWSLKYFWKWLQNRRGICYWEMTKLLARTNNQLTTNNEWIQSRGRFPSHTSAEIEEKKTQSVMTFFFS